MSKKKRVDQANLDPKETKVRQLLQALDIPFVAEEKQINVYSRLHKYQKFGPLEVQIGLAGDVANQAAIRIESTADRKKETVVGLRLMNLVMANSNLGDDLKETMKGYLNSKNGGQANRPWEPKTSKEGALFFKTYDVDDWKSPGKWKDEFKSDLGEICGLLKTNLAALNPKNIKEFNSSYRGQESDPFMSVSDYLCKIKPAVKLGGGEPGPRSSVFNNLKNKFEKWLSKRVEHPNTVERYVKTVEDLDGPNGLVVRLTGKKPPDPIGTVFKVRSFGDFQKRYSDVIYLRTRKKNDENSLKAVYSSCKQFEEIFNNLCEGGSTPDSGFRKSALNAYIEFLDDPQNLVDDGSTSAEGDTKSPDPKNDQDKFAKLNQVLTNALKGCEKVPEFKSLAANIPAFLRERQKIWFGAPGTGKSFKVNELAKSLEKFGRRCFRTTFHPDYDYATFVGCYKPCPDEKDNKEITYKFVPQVFTKAYVAAWKSWMSDEPKPVALVIEEINRGNCAQIFGQIFQSLDRYESGYSEYPVTMDQDLQRYLLDSEIKDSDYAKRGELVLPPNFFIFATMNTSDQSLFPMDSAFKRRWGWEYVPIDYSGDPGEWIIHINDKQQYSWKDFLIAINKKILKKLKSPDKQLGERFVKADNEIIDQKTFVNKVMFYLVGDAFKDDSTIRDICKGDSDDKTEFVFADFADKDNGANNLEKFFKGLGVNPIS